MMPSHRSTGGKKKKFVRKNSARRAKNTYWQGTAGSICLIVFGVLCAMTFGTAENTIVSFEVTPGSSTSSSSSSVSSSVESGTAGGGISSSASSRPRGNHDRTPLIDNLPSECLPVIVKRRQLPNRTVTEEVLPPAEAEKVEHCYVDDGPPAVPACTCPAQIVVRPAAPATPITVVVSSPETATFLWQQTELHNWSLLLLCSGIALIAILCTTIAMGGWRMKEGVSGKRKTGPACP